jgi:hypothetical protein
VESNSFLAGASGWRPTELENKLHEFDSKTQSVPAPSKQVLLSLAQDLPAIWNSPSTDMRLKYAPAHPRANQRSGDE